METGNPDWRSEYDRIWRTILNEKERRQWDKLSDEKKQAEVAKVLAFEEDMRELDASIEKNRQTTRRLGIGLSQLSAQLDEAVGQVNRAVKKAKAVGKWAKQEQKRTKGKSG